MQNLKKKAIKYICNAGPFYTRCEKCQINISFTEMKKHEKTKKLKLLDLKQKIKFMNMKLRFFLIQVFFLFNMNVTTLILQQKINKREASGTGNPYLAMRKQNLDKNTVKYYCKSPNKDSFDALVFTVHWEAQSTKYL